MNILFLVKIATFILFIWISKIKSDLREFNKILCENYKLSRKMDIRAHRLMAKYTQDKGLNIVGLKEELPCYGKNEKKNICKNEKKNKEKKKQSKENLLNKEGIHKQDKKNNFFIFETKKYSHLEKKIFKELDYENFIKNNRTIRGKLYKNIILKKYGLRLSVPLSLFLSLTISLILDLFVGCGFINGLRLFLRVYAPGFWKSLPEKIYNFLGNSLAETLKPLWTYKSWVGSKIETKVYVSTGLFGFIIYFLPFIILGFILIFWIIYYHKKVKKYEKIKFRKR
ncbi:fam-l protein [Plasmodium malariae]|uniref:Fam-l protein n=1 Tax=Plasmodium malariae TaxID=5858 RepID=A0A1D3JL12_PLAMA|nr:fam-l protein [Plasmodium malariae]SBT87272.1 fam-l protein [Plasmodium malariae]